MEPDGLFRGSRNCSSIALFFSPDRRPVCTRPGLCILDPAVALRTPTFLATAAADRPRQFFFPDQRPVAVRLRLRIRIPTLLSTGAGSFGQHGCRSIAPALFLNLMAGAACLGSVSWIPPLLSARRPFWPALLLIDHAALFLDPTAGATRLDFASGSRRCFPHAGFLGQRCCSSIAPALFLDPMAGAARLGSASDPDAVLSALSFFSL
ncbi:hypothetical protein N1I81_22745 [Bacillus sp. FSL M8-0052]|uniref:hypothetical protein n=1 Tax=Bacillus sp. FSL M8-0052 TaxID=2978203 RepID=UPI0030F78F24